MRMFFYNIMISKRDLLQIWIEVRNYSFDSYILSLCAISDTIYNTKYCYYTNKLSIRTRLSME